MSQVIGLVGHAGSGKSVMAEELEHQGFVRVRFAAVLKDMLRAFYRSIGITPDQIERRIEGDLKDKPDDLLMGRTPRYAMQMLGSEWGRVLIHQDLWANTYFEKARRIVDAGQNVVTEDVRFINEEKAVRSLGGDVHLVRGRIKDGVQMDHETENFEGIEVDSEIMNTGTIDELRAKALLLIKEPEDDPQLDLFADTAA